MKRVVLPIEIKQRELKGKIWLATQLAKAGHKVALGHKNEINVSLDVLKPDFYFALSAVNKEKRRDKLKYLKNRGTSIGVLDTEGSAFGGVEKFKTRVDPEILKDVSCYFAWGEKAAYAARKFGGLEKERVYLTGNPRFDLYKPKMHSIHNIDALKYIDDAGSFFLINTNFGVNHVDPEYHRRLATSDKRERHRAQTRLLGEFLTAISRLSEDFSSKNIVVRPHPVEDLGMYGRLFRPFDNVMVKREGDVAPWLLAADAVVHNNCTTGVEAVIAGRPVYAYTPNNLNKIRDSQAPNLVSTETNTYSELSDNLRNSNTDISHMLSDEQISIIKQHIANTDFLSAESIADAVTDHVVETKTDPKNWLKPDWDIKAKRILIRYIGHSNFSSVKSTLRKDKPDNYKFSGLERSEVLRLLSQVPTTTIPERLEVESIDGLGETYWIYSP